jgi:FtsP/CotA-like multicopper oxidase with cupredoxin domain
LEYHYRIKDNADVGTFWYHSHRHPIASEQVAGGAYGMLIVEQHSLQSYPAHLQRFFQNEVLLQYASILDKKSTTLTNLLNGKQDPLNITMNSKHYYYVRVSFVIISDSINYLQFVPSDACEVRPMAYDGVYRSSLPHPESTHKHMMTTSSRLDLAVQCHQDATIVFHQGAVSDGANLVNVQVSNQDDSNKMASPFWNDKQKTSWNPRRPYYMPDLADVNTNFWKVATWTVTMDDLTIKDNGNMTKEVSINQIRWNPAIAIRQFRLGQLVEWTLINTEKHPFHIHINRMQIVQKGGCGYRYEEGEYYDTIASDAPCRIRMQFWDFAGRIVAHCHKLHHEDKGMMVWIDILGGVEHGVNGTSQVQCSDIGL